MEDLKIWSIHILFKDGSNPYARFNMTTSELAHELLHWADEWTLTPLGIVTGSSNTGQCGGIFNFEAERKGWLPAMPGEEPEEAAETPVSDELFDKIIRMFRPYGDRKFLMFPGEEVICGPNDRAMFGFDTAFPVPWLVEDYGFTPEEARAFVKLVHEKAKKE